MRTLLAFVCKLFHFSEKLSFLSFIALCFFVIIRVRYLKKHPYVVGNYILLIRWFNI